MKIIIRDEIVIIVEIEGIIVCIKIMKINIEEVHKDILHMKGTIIDSHNSIIINKLIKI